MKSAPVVDVHAHALCPQAEGLVAGRPELAEARAQEAVAMGSDSLRHNVAMLESLVPLLTDVERRLAAMDAAGVDVQLVSPSPSQYHSWAAPELAAEIARKVSSGIASVCEADPARLVGLGLAPVQHPQVAEEALVHAVTELGLRGVEISSAAPGLELGDPAFESFWARAEDLEALVFIHPWGCSLGARLDRHYLANVVGQPVETTVALSSIIFAGVLDRRPRLKILAAHGGGYLPHYSGRSDRAFAVRPESKTPKDPPSAYLRRLYYDSLTHSPEALSSLVRQVGADRVLLGSDFPFDMGDEDPVGSVRAAPGLTEAERDAILGGSAAALLSLDVRARV
jgi:aminocarboxymuconate-semialdehyde decarboxylase